MSGPAADVADLYAVAEGPYAGRPGFFRSRWVEAPDGVELLDPARLAPGFRAGGVHCGLKRGGGTDLGVVLADDPGTRSALLLTRNAAAAAPVRVCRERSDAGSIRAAIVNSGNANAETGERGYADALRMRDETAAALGVSPERVAVAETGVIGVPLDIESVSAGIGEVCRTIADDGGDRFSAAIRTTDRWSKRCTVRLDGVTLSAQAKGAGMIEPGFATMLCFVQTDALIEDPEPLLRDAVARSVDGQMSTNDTVLLQASGRAQKPLPDGLLEAVLLQLALEIVADGEGSSRVGKAIVRDAASPREAERAARAIGNSPLVKTALLGRDPNWGRIAQAAGQALAGEELAELGPEQIEADELGEETPEAELSVSLGRGSHRGHLYFSDLTHEYIRINAEYTT